MLKLYSSLTRRTEKFIPLEDKKVSLYVCGITPYDTTHLGHAFTYIWFDALVRYLAYKGYQVNYAQNVTDIDDDILRKAKEQKTDWRKLGDFWTKRFLLDMKSLNVLPPTHYVKATGSIATIVKIATLLIKKRFAYERNENVYYDVSKFKEYGKLSHFSAKQMILISKERGGNPDDSLKKNPLDFLLWQKSGLGEPFWKSPWGPPVGGGRPGWHIECSSMIHQFLGPQIDIHGGGRDLIFPHHESEIAQSQVYTGKKPFVRYWMHTSMLLYLGEKMSKSLGNMIMVKELLKKTTPSAIRWVLLSHHYRNPWEFSEEQIKDAEEKISTISKSCANSQSAQVDQTYINRFESFMDDDLSAPSVLELLVELAEKIRKDKQNKFFLQKTLSTLLSIMGFIV